MFSLSWLTAAATVTMSFGRYAVEDFSLQDLTPFYLILALFGLPLTAFAALPALLFPAAVYINAKLRALYVREGSASRIGSGGRIRYCGYHLRKHACPRSDSVHRRLHSDGVEFRHGFSPIVWRSMGAALGDDSGVLPQCDLRDGGEQQLFRSSAGRC